MDQVNLPPQGAVMAVPMGTKVSRFPIEKFRASNAKRELITVLSANPLVTKTHYHPDLGPFYYNDMAVEAGIKTSVKYNFVIVVWETDAKGKLLFDPTKQHNPEEPPYELRIFSVAQPTYEDLVEKFEIHGDLRKTAISVRCKDEKYQELGLEIIGAAPYLQNKPLFEAIKADFQAKEKLVPMVIANNLSDERIAEGLGLAPKKGEFADLAGRQAAGVGLPALAAPAMGDAALLGMAEVEAPVVETVAPAAVVTAAEPVAAENTSAEPVAAPEGSPAAEVGEVGFGIGDDFFGDS